MIKVVALARYPIKGFSADPLTEVELTAHRTIAGDRRFGVAHANSAFDEAAPTWHKKREFLQLAHTEELAKVQTSVDDAGVMRIATGGSQLFIGNVLTPAGRRGAETVLNALLKDPRGPVRLVDAGHIALADMQQPYLSIINLATMRDIAAKTGAPVDQRRFRGNIMIDGAAPWAEFEWVGKTISISGVVFEVKKRIGRCVATSVNPVTATRDIEMPALLQKHYGHTDCGIYIEATTGGAIKPGDTLSVL
jgi:uncharacterized protein YcbX